MTPGRVRSGPWRPRPPAELWWIGCGDRTRVPGRPRDLGARKLDDLGDLDAPDLGDPDALPVLPVLPEFSRE